MVKQFKHFFLFLLMFPLNSELGIGCNFKDSQGTNGHFTAICCSQGHPGDFPVKDASSELSPLLSPRSPNTSSTHKGTYTIMVRLQRNCEYGEVCPLSAPSPNSILHFLLRSLSSFFVHPLIILSNKYMKYLVVTGTLLTSEDTLSKSDKVFAPLSGGTYSNK